MKAFPHIAKVHMLDGNSIIKEEITSGGMDLRDYFAAQAMAGVLTMLKGGNEGLITVQESTSKYAYEWADAMMEARKK
jgi:hypothetical protein